MTLLFFALYVPVVSALFTLGWIVMKLADKVERLIRRCDDIDTVEFSGELRWPIDPEPWMLDGLRDEAGDEDDTRRKQFDAIVAMDGRRH